MKHLPVKTRAISRVSAGVAVVLLAGCSASVGTSKTLDTSKLEDEIQSGIESKVQGVDVTSVSCPDDVEIKQGGKFTCTATASTGASRTVDVTMTDDQGNVHWELGKS
jgi:hypothetical protein